MPVRAILSSFSLYENGSKASTDSQMTELSTDLSDCTLCPRECHIDRIAGETGFCNSDAGISVASICAHRGEEPVISGQNGICNIFFGRCNMQCVYCQNYQISRTELDGRVFERDFDNVISQIEQILKNGSPSVGFVSPSHFVPHMKAIMAALESRGHNPVYVYNTGGYDKMATIANLEGIIDVWLPDLKYMDEALAREYSDAPHYPEIAMAAIKEMFRQKGSHIHLDSEETITSGLIIRHLVLPGHVENSKAVLKWIASELSPSVHVSLMSQYHPTPAVMDHPKLGRKLAAEEYEEVVDEFVRLGFYRGWVQEIDSPGSYRPDFDKGHPFEG